MDATWPEAAEPDPRARLEVWLRLAGLARRIEAELRDRLRREFGWSLPRFEVMSALHRADSGLRMTELAATLVVSNGNVTALVDALAAEGLVARAPDRGDRRVSIVRQTRRGRAAFAAIAAAHEGWIDEIFAGLDRADLDRLDALTDAAGAALATK